MKVKMKILLMALLISYVESALSAGEWIRNASIIRTLSDDANYGGCMVQINVAPTTVSCPGNWYHMNCLANETYGKRTYATALMAFAMNAKVHMYVDDSNKLNTYCAVKRIDVTR